MFWTFNIEQALFVAINISYNLRHLHSFFRSHAKEKPYPVEMSDKPFIQAYDKNKGNHNNYRKLR